MNMKKIKIKKPLEDRPWLEKPVIIRKAKKLADFKIQDYLKKGPLHSAKHVKGEEGLGGFPDL